MTENNICQAQIQQGEHKGKICGKPAEKKYCKKHTRHEIIDKAIQENIRYCDIPRGCFTVLEEHQSKCIHCLRRAQIRDRKREDKKRQDPNLCLDCGNTLTSETRAVGKHDKKLRRCVPCYKKLLEVESQREPRERNFKSEAFTNKHVIWNQYVKSAKKRGIDFKLKKDTFNSLIIQECFYCKYFKDGEVNGIDRVDNNSGYLEENVVPCCQTCNLAKGTQHPQEFIDKMYSINNYHISSTEIHKDFIEQWKDTYLSKIIPKFSTYMKSANSRNITFKINENEFNSLVEKSCYLCGLNTSDTNKNGIDRINNNFGYVYENCKPCCGHCNILKKDISYEKILEISGKIFTQYEYLTNQFKVYCIKKRTSKVEPRNKVINPIEGIIQEREYKSIDKLTISNSIPVEIQEILENKEDTVELKQWKTKQIYEAISENKENKYKEYCEQHNDISTIENWESKWVSFILSIKGKTYNESEKIIKEFVEDLRRVRHNKLCHNKNSQIVDREDRQLWPATTIVRAFLEGKIETFKKFTEEQTEDKSDDQNWLKRWQIFIESLQNNKENKDKLKSLCSKFLNAQRIRRYRNKQN